MLQWVRAADGLIFGVCRGLARRLGFDTTLIRILWVISILCFGTGFLAYLILAIALPREDKVDQALHRKVLGVCSKIAQRSGIEVGLVRTFTLGLTALSLGTMVLLYFIVWLAFLLAKEEDRRLSQQVR